MKVGDLVKAVSKLDYYEANPGIIVAFGEGDMGYVHVLAEDGTIMIFNHSDVEVISESR